MNRYAHAIFCDDIRQEVGGKTTMVGIYTGQLVASEIPCVLPKICLALSLVTPQKRKFEEICVTGSFNDVEIFKMELSKKQIESIVTQAPERTEPVSFYTVQLMAILTPFQIEKAGKLKLSVLADGKKLECGGLEIKHAPPEMVI
ncbi:DUF6941 family protein [Pseudomonas sp. ICMP 10191]|uniref:DUF6941 family protein n=1 Tax=Pseudomonas sp. ICMP 10191 TaxID=1198294 RepID=UPI000730C8B8|nr:hypothetical protein [Pseudomonas sp. ICMP 10191]KTB97813.1 hypothetical protein AO388_26640 [Pseudomonas sp. ICMP 10191]